MLKDYPEHIEDLQKGLSSVLDRHPRATLPFERAVWILEDYLAIYVFEARNGLEEAKASGDPDAVLLADQKLRAMVRARSGNGGMKSLSELWDYFHGVHGDR
ncbi:TPA: hypothetical protein QEL15_003903 [Stenotrophomonas maltophilia]|nr:hypothetical protein [Stenotrophomonas maltophilia]